MGHRPTQKEKTQRAFQAYLDLLDAAEWFKAQMRAPLESFDLTMEGFRVLTVLYREGALPIAEVARRRAYSLQNMHRVVARLEARRWVGRRIVTLPPAEIRKAVCRRRSAASNEGDKRLRSSA
jgi:MarR family